MSKAIVKKNNSKVVPEVNKEISQWVGVPTMQAWWPELDPSTYVKDMSTYDCNSCVVESSDRRITGAYWSSSMCQVE